MIKQITTVPCGRKLGCSGSTVSRISNRILLALLAISMCLSGPVFNILKQVCSGLEGMVEKGSCQEEKKHTSYPKATLKDKLRYRKAFHMIFDSFLFALLHAGGHDGEQLHGKEGVWTELKREEGEKKLLLHSIYDLYRKC